MTTITAPKEHNRTERLVARVTASDKQMIDHAAALAGSTTTHFLVSELRKAARRVIEEHETMRLSERDRRAFVAAVLEEDTEPNQALRKAARSYRESNL